MKVPRLSERLAVTALEAKRVPRATPQLLKGRSPGSCQNGGQKVELPQEHGLGEGHPLPGRRAFGPWPTALAGSLGW